MANESLVGVVRDLTWDQEGGILLETIRPGEGNEGPRIGDLVSVHYVAKLENGTIFESSRSKAEPFQFTIGKAVGKVMAWDCAIANMRMGELARITCKPEYAYEYEGATRPSMVPRNAMVIFEVELIDWQGVDLSPDQDRGIIKRMDKQGKRVATPEEGAMVTIKYRGYVEGEEFESREVTYMQGEGDEARLISGLEIGAKHMKLKEQDRLTISPKYAYGEQGCPELGVPSNATLVYHVEMVDFKQPPDPLDMDVEETLEECKRFKDKGTAYFKKENYERAINYYKRIVSYLEPVKSGLQGDQDVDKHQLLLAAHLNLALCHLKLGNYINTESECIRALELNANSVKALYRRGQAHLERGMYSKAMDDFSRVLELEPSNRTAQTQLSVSQQRQREAYVKEKQLYSQMFAGLSKIPQGAEGGAPSASYAESSPQKGTDPETLPERNQLDENLIEEAEHLRWH